MTIIYRSVKGSNLTPTEVDDNFHDVDDRVTDLEALEIGRGIESIDVTGNQMTVTYTDASVDVFPLPTVDLVDLFRGAWQPTTPYVQNEIVTALGSIFLVLQDHTSASTFDPNAIVGMGPAYQLFLKNPAIPTFERDETTFTPEASDANSYNRMTHVDGCLVTLPLDDDVDFPLDTELHFRQCSTEPVTIDESTGGAIINGMDGFTNATPSEGSVITVKKIGPDEWDLFGRLTVV